MIRLIQEHIPEKDVEMIYMFYDTIDGVSEITKYSAYSKELAKLVED